MMFEPARGWQIEGLRSRGNFLVAGAYVSVCKLDAFGARDSLCESRAGSAAPSSTLEAESTARM